MVSICRPRLGEGPRAAVDKAADPDQQQPGQAGQDRHSRARESRDTAVARVEQRLAAGDQRCKDQFRADHIYPEFVSYLESLRAVWRPSLQTVEPIPEPLA